MKSLFGAALSGITSPLSTLAKSSPHVVGLIFFLKKNFYTILGHFMLNSIYTYILNIYDLVWFGVISTIVGYLMPNPIYTYI